MHINKPTQVTFKYVGAGEVFTFAGRPYIKVKGATEYGVCLEFGTPLTIGPDINVTLLPRATLTLE